MRGSVSLSHTAAAILVIIAESALAKRLQGRSGVVMAVEHCDGLRTTMNNYPSGPQAVFFLPSQRWS